MACSSREMKRQTTWQERVVKGTLGERLATWYGKGSIFLPIGANSNVRA